MAYVLAEELRPLARLFDDPKPSVLIVVGTGISIGATRDPRASWKGLLLDGVNRLGDLGIEGEDVLNAERILIGKAFSGEFDLDEILQRAESITRRLDAPHLADWFKDSVGSFKTQPDQRQSLDAIANLAASGALILTTNYDSLLSEVTNYEPVTWEEPRKVLDVINRRRKGIIHIHGHWSQPSSVILGRTSYQRIRSTFLTQTELRSLWLQFHWLYLGCGSGGLDDPNLGALLRWADELALGESALSDYFLSAESVIAALPERFGKSSTFVKFTYTDHATDLPALLQALAPAARVSPFERIGPQARRVRRPEESPLVSPFPSWDEYLRDVVPPLGAEETVVRRLDEHGWAFVVDVASVGKSTLAYRIAARENHRHSPAYHLLLSQPTVEDAESDISPQAALGRLARPGVLLVIDDCHQRPELAHALWQQWRERPTGSRLLLLATRLDRLLNLPGATSLRDLEKDAVNPAIALEPTAGDLGLIARYVLNRLKPGAGLEKVPEDELAKWHSSFGRELGAFVIAVSERQRQLENGDFNLPESAAANWMKQRHLRNFDARDIENVICLAVFGDQELELDVPEVGLPHPPRIHRLLESSLVERIIAEGGDYIYYSLREPSWGRLILGSVDVPVDTPSIIVDTAAKSLAFASTISARLQRLGRDSERLLYWQALAQIFTAHPETLAQCAFEAPLGSINRFLTHAADLGCDALVTELWRALEAQPAKVAEQAFQARLDSVQDFVVSAQSLRQQRLLAALWQRLEAAPERLPLLDAPFDYLSRFLTFVRKQRPAFLPALWQMLGSRRATIVERVGDATLDSLSAFLVTAHEQEQSVVVNFMWAALAAQPEKLIDRAFRTALKDVAGFLATAEQQGQKECIQPVWTALAQEPEKLVQRAIASPLSDVSAFLSTAEGQGQNALVEKMWQVFATQIDRLAEHAGKQFPNHLMSFLIRAPKDLRKEVIQRLKIEDWQYSPSRSQRFSTGAPGLAGQFGMNDREDLKIALIDNILRRRNPADFVDRKSSLMEISRLASFVSLEQEAEFLDLLRVVCTEKWLTGAYRYGSILGIAGALHMIAVHQPPQAIRCFWNRELGSRLIREFTNTRLDDQGLNAATQLLGSSQLAGWTINRTLLHDVDVARVGRLPRLVPHRPESLIAEQWARQLWFGLRVIALVAPRNVIVDRALIDQTLQLWRKNIEGTDDWPGTNQRPDSNAHRINVSMVKWLEDCVQAGSGRLVRSQEPLWMLTGFSHNPGAA